MGVNDKLTATCDHGESMWGRCVACGMTWEQQAEARKAAADPEGGGS